MSGLAAKLLEVIDGGLSEDEAWEYVKSEYAAFLVSLRLAGAWTVAPRKSMGNWRIELHREDEDVSQEAQTPA